MYAGAARLYAMVHVAIYDAVNGLANKSRSSYRDGFKAHVAIEPETGIITACGLTAANVADAPPGVALLAGEAPGLQVLGDSAYGSPEPPSTRGKATYSGH